MSAGFEKILIQSFPEDSLTLVILLTAIFGLGSLLLFVMSLPQWLYHRRIRKSGITQVDKMSGWEFEKFLQGLFERLGYRAKLVGSGRGDYGGDLVLDKDGTKILVQAKRYNRRVGIKAVQEVVAARKKYNCDKTMVVTNNYLTRPARNLGHANSVTMWTRDKLIDAILLSNKSKQPTLSEQITNFRLFQS